MATTPSTNETLDKVTTDQAIADTATPQASGTSEAVAVMDDTVADEAAKAAKVAEAAEAAEALQRADDSVVADDLAKDNATVDVSAFMATPAEAIVPEEIVPKDVKSEELDAVTGQVNSAPRDEQNSDTKESVTASPVTASVESDLAAEEAALAAEALAITARMGEEERARKAEQDAKKTEQEERLAKAKAELAAAQEERRAKVDKALQAKPNRIKPEPEPEEEDEEESQTLLGHLGELRVRVVRCFIAIGLAFMLCYSFSERIFNELMVPLVSAMPPDSKLIFTALPEAFFVYMQVALVAAVFVASPYIFYQVWAFISPGLYEEEKKTAIPIAFFSASFFIGGAAFCYFQVFPYAFQFFMGFATDLILPMPSLSEYLGFALKMLFAFGFIFEMPLFAFFLSRIGLVTADMMRKFRKYAILCMFIVAAILTPPDVFSQCLMAAPMLILYEISILIAAAVGKKKQEDAEADEAESTSIEDNRPMQGD